MGKEATSHPHWPAWAANLAERSAASNACEEWQKVGAWIQSVDLAATIEAVGQDGEPSARKPALRV